jgi:hypothetical protein
MEYGEVEWENTAGEPNELAWEYSYHQRKGIAIR